MKQWIYFGCGFSVGLVTLSLSSASVPRRGHVTDDTAIYQNLTEISVPRQKKLDFDNDINRLSQMERRYSERNLTPLVRHPRLRAPIQRVSQQKYRFSGKQRPVPAAAGVPHRAPRLSPRTSPRTGAPVAPAPGIPVSRAEISPFPPSLAAAPSMGVPEESTLKKLDLGRADESGSARKARLTHARRRY